MNPRILILTLPLLLATTACSGGFFGNGKDPNGNDDGGSDDGGSDDGGTDAGDTDADTDADTDTDTSGTDDTDTDTDTDTDGGDTDTDTDTDGGVDPDTTDDDGDGFSEDDGDCDDTDGDIGPGETEIPYDGVDNDCDDATPDDDLDRDGFTADEDCDDDDASAYPGAPEDTDDGVDNDCDDEVDERFDKETVEAGCDCGSPSAIAIDSADDVHIVWFNADDGTLMADKLEDGEWEGGETVVDYDYAAAGEYLDAVIDDADRLQVGYTWWDYTYSGDTELDFIFKSADGTWSDEYVVEDSRENGSYNLGYFVSIALDASGLPSFAYYDYDYREPRIADILSDPWSTIGLDALYTHVDENYLYQIGIEDCDIGYWTSIAVDSTGYDNVAYYDDCSLAQEAQFTRLDFDLDALAYSETIADDGWYTSLALKSDGTKCVAYHEAGGADLAFACSTDGGFSWSTETVDRTGSVGWDAQLVFDDADEAWIAYYDMTNGDLKVAHDDGGSWEIITVDSAGDVGRSPSIAIDSKGQVHISYYDVDGASLKYAVGG